VQLPEEKKISLSHLQRKFENNMVINWTLESSITQCFPFISS